jgi:hypothetical protein
MPKSKTQERSLNPWWIGGFLVVVLACAALWYTTSSYGEVSADAYQYARSLYTICNQRDTTRLEKISTMIEADFQAQKITPRDHQYLMKLIGVAKAGNWTDAQNSIRKLLEAQNKEQ